jgi:hypothetical protein
LKMLGSYSVNFNNKEQFSIFIVFRITMGSIQY